MKKYFPIIILLGCALLFVLGIVELFELRFEAGDVYPPYSTLRADPLGAMAFYESLGKLPGISVRRDFSASNLLPEEPRTAYLHLAAENFEWDDLSDDDYREIKKFVGGGGRLVITYFPQTREMLRSFDDEDETNPVKSAHSTPKLKDNNPQGQTAKKKRHLKGDVAWVNLEDEWGFHESFQELPQDGDVYSPVTVVNRSVPTLPETLDWHSGMVFTNCAAAWQAIYSRGNRAVVIERSLGQGSVVIASDSYFLSNEAMTKNRHSELLAWLVGANTQVVFDEAHLGILDASGVATLMRQYRLHGLAAGLLLLAGLFIWKNSTSLAPPPPEGAREDFVAGKDSASGFVNLLRRNIPPREVFGVCFAEWKKSVAPSGRLPGARQQQAEAIFQSENSLPARQRNPIASYRQISETLGNRRKII